MRTQSTYVQHQSQVLVRELAEDLHQPLEVARAVFDEQLARLSRGAKVRTYLPIFAAREARKILAPH